MALLKVDEFITTWRTLNGAEKEKLEEAAVSASQEKPAFGSYHYLEETRLVKEYYASLKTPIHIDGFEAVPAYLEIDAGPEPSFKSVFTVLLPIKGTKKTPIPYFGKGKVIIVECGKLDHHEYPLGYTVKGDTAGKHIIKNSINVSEAVAGAKEFT